MHTVEAAGRSESLIHASPDGLFARRSSIVVAVIYTMILAAMIIAIPELINSAILWFLWALVMAAVIANHAMGTRLHRRATGS
jgi:hypothetical protein